MHPFKLFLYVAIVGIFILFVFLAFGFALTNDPDQYFLPNYFTLSTIFILMSSLTMSKSLTYYKADNPKLLNRYLIATFLLGLLFIVSQMKGWKELMDKRTHDGNVVYFTKLRNCF